MGIRAARAEEAGRAPEGARGESAIPAGEDAALATTILEAMTDEVSILDARTLVVLDANQAFLAGVGLPRVRVLGRTCHSLTHGLEPPCDRGHGCCPVSEMLRTGNTACCEHEHLGPRGEVKHVSISVSPIRDASGTISRALHVLRDVTAHKRGLAQTAAVEARFRAMIDHLPILIWFKDVGGRFLAVNRAFAAACGRDHPREVVGKTDREVWSPELAEQYLADDVEVLRSGRPKHVEEPIVLGGEATWFETFKLPVRDDAGTLLGTTGFARDITERRIAEQERLRLEAQFQQSQKMEAVGQLAGGVAHDFNNLLSVIISYSDFALDDLPAASPVRADILQVRQAGERAAGLTRQLLAFSRKQTIDPCEVETNGALVKLVKMLRRLIGEDITLALDLAPDTPSIFVDPVQLDQVVTNLVVNARDAMPGGGSLVITTRMATPDARARREWPDAAPGEHVLVSIADTGTGIPEDVLPRIFEPFFTTKEKGRGTGLGLSMVYGAVRQNRGLLSVVSEVGKGTTFEIYLPVAEAACGTPVDAGAAEADRGRGETVLVVEDDEAVRRTLGRILRSAGYNVIDTGGGAEALGRFREAAGKVALVLTDVVMPEMSGPLLALELAREQADVKVLFVTGYTDDTLEHQGVLPATANRVPKPVERRVLLRRVRELLDG